MDPEQTFLRVHARLSGMLSQLLTPRIRLALEYLYLAGAVALFCLLVVMHTNFVQQPGCSSEFSGVEFGEAQLVQIKIISGGLWASKGASYIMDLQNLGRSAEKILEVNGDKFNILVLELKGVRLYLDLGLETKNLNHSQRMTLTQLLLQSF